MSAGYAVRSGANDASAGTDCAADRWRPGIAANANDAAVHHGHKPDDARADADHAAIDGRADVNECAANGLPHQQGAG